MYTIWQTVLHGHLPRPHLGPHHHVVVVERRRHIVRGKRGHRRQSRIAGNILFGHFEAGRLVLVLRRNLNRIGTRIEQPQPRTWPRREIKKGLCQIFEFFKWANPGLFSSISSFQINITILAINKCEKLYIRYRVLGFTLTTFATWVSSHNH